MNENVAMNKNYLVEIYRFIVAVSIAIFHFMKLTSNGHNLRLGVEFFFILSGYLLVEGIESHTERPANSFVLSKLKKIYPSYFIAISLAILINAIIKNTNIFILCYQNIHSFLLLTDIITKYPRWLYEVNQLWFIAAQIQVCFILSYFLKCKKSILKAILLLIIVVYGGYVVLIKYNGNMDAGRAIEIFSGKFWIPLLFVRGLAGMSIGVGVHVFKKSIIDKFQFEEKDNKIGVLISIICFLGGLVISSLPRGNEIQAHTMRILIVTFLYSISLIFAFTFATSIKYSDSFKRLASFLSAQSMNIYMSHLFVITGMKYFVDLKIFYMSHLIIFVILSIIFAMLFGLLVNFTNTILSKMINRKQMV